MDRVRSLTFTSFLLEEKAQQQEDKKLFTNGHESKENINDGQLIRSKTKRNATNEAHQCPKKKTTENQKKRTKLLRN